MKFIKKISKETSNAESSNLTRILRGSILSIVLTIAGWLPLTIIFILLTTALVDTCKYWD